MDAKLVIIDYEYSSYNYRAFDFANHFHEWMFDYTNKSYPFYFLDKDKFPSKEQRVSWVHRYTYICAKYKLVFEYKCCIFCVLSITCHVFCSMFWKYFNSSHAYNTEVTYSQTKSYFFTRKTYKFCSFIFSSFSWNFSKYTLKNLGLDHLKPFLTLTKNVIRRRKLFYVKSMDFS